MIEIIIFDKYHFKINLSLISFFKSLIEEWKDQETKIKYKPWFKKEVISIEKSGQRINGILKNAGFSHGCEWFHIWLPCAGFFSDKIETSVISDMVYSEKESQWGRLILRNETEIETWTYETRERTLTNE